jgi:hypothetical protein
MTDTLPHNREYETAPSGASRINPADIPMDFSAEEYQTQEVTPYVAQPTQEIIFPESTPETHSMQDVIETINQIDGFIPDELIERLEAHDTSVIEQLDGAKATNDGVRQFVDDLQTEANTQTEKNITDAHAIFTERRAMLEMNRDLAIAEMIARTDKELKLEYLRFTAGVEHETTFDDTANSLVDSAGVSISENNRMMNRLTALWPLHIARRDEEIAAINHLNVRHAEIPGEIATVEGTMTKLLEEMDKGEEKKAEYLKQLDDLEEQEGKTRRSLKKKDLKSIDETYVEGGPLPIEAKETAKKNILALAESPELTIIMKAIVVCNERINENLITHAGNERLYDKLMLSVTKLYQEQNDIPTNLFEAKGRLAAEFGTPFTELDVASARVVDQTDKFSRFLHGDTAAFGETGMPRHMKNTWLDLIAFNDLVSGGAPKYGAKPLAIPKFDDIMESFTLLDPQEGDEALLAVQETFDKTAEQVANIRRLTGLDIDVEKIMNMGKDAVRSIFKPSIKAEQKAIDTPDTKAIS